MEAYSKNICYSGGGGRYSIGPVTRYVCHDISERNYQIILDLVVALIFIVILTWLIFYVKNHEITN